MELKKTFILFMGFILLIGFVGLVSADKLIFVDSNYNENAIYNISDVNASRGNYTGNVGMANLTATQKITFAFGEIIDNIVNGLIKITGDLIATGDINATKFFGTYNWTEDSKYLSFDDVTLSFNETELNLTIGIFNDSMKTYVDAWDTEYNNTMKSYVDGTNASMGNYVVGLNTTMAGFVTSTNTSMKSYVDAWDIDFNSTMTNYVDGQDTLFNDSVVNWADGKFVVNSGGDSLSGQYDFNGGWTSGGLSIINGDVYAQTGWFYNISGLTVTTLFINGSLLPVTGFDNQFDISNASLRWKDLYLGGEVFSNGTGDNYFLGDVGIGTSSPGNKLDIVTGSTTDSAVHIGEVDNEGGYLSSFTDSQISIGGGIERVGGSWYARATTASQIQMSTGEIKFRTDDSLTDGNTFTPSDRMIIDASGKVGIGTSSPGSQLHIESNTAFDLSSTNTGQDTIFITDTTAGTGQDNVAGSIMFGDVTGGTGRHAGIVAVQTDDDNNEMGLAFYTHPSAASGNDIAEQMRIAYDGKVGIGTTSPTAPLQIKSDGTSGLKLANDAAYNTAGTEGDNTLEFTDAQATPLTVGKIISYASTSNDYGFKIQGYNNDVGSLVTRMVIEGDGNVGIGTTTPQNKLNVIGSINQTNGNLTGNLIYGEMWAHSDTGTWTADIVTQNIYINLSINSTGTDNSGGTNNGFILDVASSSLIAQVPGLYKADFSISTGNVGNNQEYQFVITKNNIPQNQTDVHRKIGAAGDVGNAGSSGFITLVSGDRINLQARNNGGVGDLDLHAINVNLIRIGN